VELKEKLAMTSIVVTHDMSSAYKIADTIAMIHEGRIIFCGTPAEIRASHNPYIQQFIRGQRKSYYALEDEDSYSSAIDLQKVKQRVGAENRRWQPPSTPEPANE
jgi:phospholipid/cholesterol/gamma-HCH transport system ATP-binding protein